MDIIEGINRALCDHNMTVEYAASVRVMQVAGQTPHFLPQKTVVKEQLFNKSSSSCHDGECLGGVFKRAGETQCNSELYAN